MTDRVSLPGILPPSDDDIRRATMLYAQATSLWMQQGKPPPPGPSVCVILVMAQALADARAHNEQPVDLTMVEDQRAAMVIELMRGGAGG